MMIRLLLSAIFASLLFGQSPYQRLGYGELYASSDPFYASVGAGLVAFEDSVRATYWNPASNNSQKRVFFGAALASDFVSTDAALVNRTKFSEVMVSIPVGKRIAASFQISPVADFDSDFQSVSETGTYLEQSSGGVWDYALGVGTRVRPNLDLGIKFHMLHGFLRRDMKLQSDEIDEHYVIKGGIDGSSIELGAVTTFGQNVRLGMSLDLVTTRPVLSAYDSLGGTSTSMDFEETLNAWPSTIRLGVLLKQSARTSYLVGISQQIFPASGFEDSRIFALPDGWEVLPVGCLHVSMLRSAMDRSSRNWLKRSGWQTGFSVKNHYLSSSSGDMIYELAWNSGLNLGLRNGRSMFDVSTEIGTRSGEATLPAEMFAKVKFGIQLNDVWFRKIKRR